MKSKILYTIGAITVILLSVLITGKLIISKPVTKTNELSENLLTVKANTAKNNNYNSNIKYRGRISSYENISLSAEVSGKIMQGSVPFKTGQAFKKNDLLIQIYNEDVKTALMSGKSSFLRTISTILPDMNFDFPNEYAKWTAFFSQIKVDRNLPKLPETKTEQEQIFLASKGVLSEYYSLRQQEINLKKYAIYAPFDGSFKSVSREIGSVASMGAELASIIRTNKLEITVPVLPEDAKFIKIGNQVELIGSYSSEIGKVSRIADFVDASTQSINIYIDYYPNGGNAFITGEFIDAEFNISKKINGIKIPREALLDNNQVYIIQDQVLTLKSIEIERMLDDHIIISGIKDGETIVMESLANISEGTKVLTRI
ncbi:MAG: HlyD family efflux transporter periplasmic adaptor subunit [Bacteroidales bacterium]|nr:HlyD family efflux transporter periplasmic adaptor subunit [Bacteroidales bacterium]